NFQQVNGCNVTSHALKIKEYPATPSSYSVSNQSNDCNDSLVTLTGPYSPNYSYQWFNNGVALPSAMGRIYNTMHSGTYSLTVTSVNGCSGSSSSINIPQINLLASITIHSRPWICAGGSASLTANPGNGYSYQWIKNDSEIAGATAQQYIAH